MFGCRNCEEVQEINKDCFAVGRLTSLWQWHSNHVQHKDAQGLQDLLRLNCSF